MDKGIGISKLDLKRRNRMQVLYALRRNGPLSRIDIAAKVGLTRAAVTIITNEMIDQGVLKEIGEMQYLDTKVPKGRKKILLDIVDNYRLVVGVMVEDAQLTIGISDLKGNILDHRYRFYRYSKLSHSSLLDMIIDGCLEILKSNCLPDKVILGLGVGIQPAMYELVGASGVPVDSLGENIVPDFSVIKQHLEKELNMTVLVDNSICGLAIANADFHSVSSAEVVCPKNSGNFVFLRTGRHYNSIFVHNHQPQNYYTHHTRLVERMIVTPGGNHYQGYPDGSVRAELCHDVLLDVVKSELYSRDNTPTLWQITAGNPDAITMDNVLTAIINRDSGLEQISNDWIDKIVILINNLVCASNPEKIIIHSALPGNREAIYVKNRIMQINPDLANMIYPSIVDAQNSFIGGCALVVKFLFFHQGGTI